MCYALECNKEPNPAEAEMELRAPTPEPDDIPMCQG